MKEIWKTLALLILISGVIFFVLKKFNRPTSVLKGEEIEDINNAEVITIKGINYIEMKKGDLLYKISADYGNFSFDRGEGNLKNIDGEIYLSGGKIIKVHGKIGKVVENGEKIILEDSVRGTMDDGTELSSDEMYYSAKDHFITSNTPVSLKNRTGNINASTMFVNLRDDIIHFSGKVDAVIKRFKR